MSFLSNRPPVMTSSEDGPKGSYLGTPIGIPWVSQGTYESTSMASPSAFLASSGSWELPLLSFSFTTSSSDVLSASPLPGWSADSSLEESSSAGASSGFSGSFSSLESAAGSLASSLASLVSWGNRTKLKMVSDSPCSS